MVALQKYADHQEEVVADLKQHADGLTKQLKASSEHIKASSEHIKELTIRLDEIQNSRIYKIYYTLSKIRDKIYNIRSK
jgi:chaperonin cofactor prefoldin